jgi:uncharacterized protein (TIGR02246 family)
MSATTDDERAIRALVERWMAATKAGDIATGLSLMADDVIFLVPGQEPFGKEAFAAASAAMNSVRMDGQCDILEIQVLGDWAYLRNYIEITVTPAQGGTLARHKGHTLSILRKNPDGQWVLARDANLVMAAT